MLRLGPHLGGRHRHAATTMEKGNEKNKAAEQAVMGGVRQSIESVVVEVEGAPAPTLHDQQTLRSGVVQFPPTSRQHSTQTCPCACATYPPHQTSPQRPTTVAQRIFSLIRTR